MGIYPTDTIGLYGSAHICPGPNGRSVITRAAEGAEDWLDPAVTRVPTPSLWHGPTGRLLT